MGQTQSTPPTSTPPTPRDPSPTPSTPAPLPDPNDRSSGVHYNPFPPGAYPPPWYRSPTDEPGRPRARGAIVGGVIIPNAEARAWFKRLSNIELKANHSQDITIIHYLGEAVHKAGGPYEAIKLAQRRDVVWYDFIFVTQRAEGPFMNVGPSGLDEVLQDDLKGIFKPGKEEEEASELLLREFGRWTHDFVSRTQ